MDLELKGKVVIVTGASKGIGWACAEAFASEAAKVATGFAQPRESRCCDRALTEHGLRTVRGRRRFEKRHGRRTYDRNDRIIGMGGKVANPVHLPEGADNAALMLATEAWPAHSDPEAYASTQ